jgi:diaminohydroxyphosphoribosylaminopyrimidine deaminase/5-amino-6-(5-phosphoribosylamino)uracil reductase
MPDPSREIPEFDPGRVQSWLSRSDRPYVTLKAAVTLDGRIASATGESRWITGEAARHLAHCLRALHGAVLVGANTALRDDPRLTVRVPGLEARPARIVLDSTARTPPDAQVFAPDGARRFLIAGSRVRRERLDEFSALGVDTFRASTERPEAREFLPWLRAQGIESILVEGGGLVHGHFIANAEAQELFLFVAGRVLGDARAPAWCAWSGAPALEESARIRLSDSRRVGEDILIHGLFEPPPAPIR